MSCPPKEAERLYSDDRYSLDPATTFKDGYPAIVSGFPPIKFMVRLFTAFNDKDTSTLPKFSKDMQQRLNIAWSNVARAVNGWIRADGLVGGSGISDKKYTRAEFSFFSVEKRPKEMGAYANIAFSSVHKELRFTINNPVPLNSTFIPPTSQRAQAAHLVLYTALVVAAAVATNLRGRDTNGAPFILTYDVYAAVAWVSGAIEDVYDAGPPSASITFADIFYAVTAAFHKENKFYNGNESKHNVFYQLDFVVQNDAVAYGGFLMGPKTNASLLKPLESSVTFDWSTLDQACVIEALFDGAFFATHRDCSFAVFTRYSYLPLKGTSTSAEAIWGEDDLRAFGLMFTKDVAAMIGGAKPPPTPADCTLPNYWSTSQKKCIEIPPCGPGQVFNPATEACEGSKVCPSGWYLNPKGVCTLIPTCGPGETFNPVTEACELSPVPSGGGGGGGSGDGGGIALLLLLLLVGLALATR